MKSVDSWLLSVNVLFKKFLAQFSQVTMSCSDLYEQNVYVSGQYMISGTLTSCGLNGTFTDGTQCQLGWIGNNQLCYRFTVEAGNYAAVRNYCWKSGGLLASILDSSELNFVTSAVIGSVKIAYISEKIFHALFRFLCLTCNKPQAGELVCIKQWLRVFSIGMMVHWILFNHGVLDNRLNIHINAGCCVAGQTFVIKIAP